MTLEESMTLEEYVDRRNAIQFKAEDMQLGAQCWQKLGVANRHIERVVGGTLSLVPAVEREIEHCLVSTAKWLEEKKAE